MVLLESFDKFSERAEFDPTSGKLRRFPKHEDPTIASRPIDGSFAIVDGHMMIFYRDAGKLRLKIDDSDFELTSSTRMQLERGDVNTLTIAQDDVQISSWTYKPYEIDEVDRSRMYLNPSIEEEHFDFGLFVSNVFNTQDRRDRVFRRNPE